MQKEYRTISEVVGALMLVNQVEGVKYRIWQRDELRVYGVRTDNSFCQV